MPPLRPDQAARLFMQPRSKAETSARPPFLHAERVDLDSEGVRLTLWRAGKGPTVLLLHGWQGGATDMQFFAAPLLGAGFSVTAVDMPAHGASGSTSTSLTEFIRAVRGAQPHIGDVHAIIAHSMGCAVAVETMKAGSNVNAVAFISAPARSIDHVLEFGMVAGLGRNGTQQMIDELRALGVDVSGINLPETVKSFDVPALFIHSDDDRIVPPNRGKEVASVWPGAKFMQVRGLGHHQILSDPDVVATATSFVIQTIMSR